MLKGELGDSDFGLLTTLENQFPDLKKAG